MGVGRGQAWFQLWREGRLELYDLARAAQLRASVNYGCWYISFVFKQPAIHAWTCRARPLGDPSRLSVSSTCVWTGHSSMYIIHSWPGGRSPQVITKWSLKITRSEVFWSALTYRKLLQPQVLKLKVKHAKEIYCGRPTLSFLSSYLTQFFPLPRQLANADCTL